MVSAAVKERLRRLREKHHLGEYRNKKTHHVRKYNRVKTHMARRTHRRSGGSGIMSLAKKALFGVGASMALSMVAPQLASNPLIKGGVGLLAGGPVGAISAVVLPNVLAGATATSSQQAF